MDETRIGIDLSNRRGPAGLNTIFRVIYYQTFCGCIHEKKDLVKKIGRLVCPKHFKKIEVKYAGCFACRHKVFSESKQAKIPFLCPDCDPSWGTRQAYRSVRVENKKNESIEDICDCVEEAMSKSECIFRPLCIEVHIKKQSIPCEECRDFKKKNDLDQLRYNINLSQLDAFIINGTDHVVGQKMWGEVFEKRVRDLG